LAARWLQDIHIYNEYVLFIGIKYVIYVKYMYCLLELNMLYTLNMRHLRDTRYTWPLRAGEQRIYVTYGSRARYIYVTYAQATKAIQTRRSRTRSQLPCRPPPLPAIILGMLTDMCDRSLPRLGQGCLQPPHTHACARAHTHTHAHTLARVRAHARAHTHRHLICVITRK